MGGSEPSAGDASGAQAASIASSPSNPLANLRHGGPLWAWPVIGIALVAIAGQVAGPIGALLVGGMGLVTFVLVGSELLFKGRHRLYAAGIAFAAACFLVLVALAQHALTGPGNAAPPSVTSAAPHPSGSPSMSSTSPPPQPDLRGKTITPELLAGQSLAGIDLRGAVLRGIDLRGRSLDGAMLAGTSLVGSRLDGASLRGADLSGADLRRVCLRRTDLRGAILSGADAVGADVRDAQLSPGAISTADRWPDSTALADPLVCS